MVDRRIRAHPRRPASVRPWLEARKREAIGTLAGGIVHDFNNILAAILGSVALAREDVDAGHPGQQYLEQIGKAGQRARSLVRQILAFSRRQPAEFVAMSLRGLVEKMVAMLQSTAGPAVRWRPIVSGERLAVQGNMTQLQQVLMNLGTNALHALHEGAGSIEVGLARAGPGRGARHRRDAWRDDRGDQHGRALKPLRSVPAADRPRQCPRTARCGRPRPGARNGQHVLQVDDDEVMALTVQGLLQRLGHRVSVSPGAREAIAAITDAPEGFELVVTDFNMPKHSGPRCP